MNIINVDLITRESPNSEHFRREYKHSFHVLFNGLFIQCCNTTYLLETSFSTEAGVHCVQKEALFREDYSRTIIYNCWWGPIASSLCFPAFYIRPKQVLFFFKLPIHQSDLWKHPPCPIPSEFRHPLPFCVHLKCMHNMCRLDITSFWNSN